VRCEILISGDSKEDPIFGAEKVLYAVPWPPQGIDS
jgi:hypothetical protein